MASTNFDTSNKTYRQLIGNGLTYVVPAFQRDYSWEEDQWDDLWQDIRNALHEDSGHYMGYLVLQTTDNKTHVIVDGQQRLTTLSLFVLALLKGIEDLVKQGIEPEDNKRRLEALRASYIGYLDPVTLVGRSKLKLNRNNDSYFQNYLVTLLPLPKYDLRESVHRLRKGFEWWDKAIKAHMATNKSGAELARMVDSAADRLFFTVITVSEQLNAFTVFETLNARGVRLSPTDLLKNYLFSVVDRGGAIEEEMQQLEERWDRMVSSLAEESFTTFLRVHWNSRHDLVRESELFKIIKQQIKDRGAVFSLMRDMEADLETYLAMLDGRSADADQQSALHDLKLFGIRQILPLLLATKRRMTDTDFAAVLRICSITVFRYSVIGSQANNDLERACSNAINAITADTGAVTLATILASFREIYRPDRLFESDFAEKQFKTSQPRNKKLVRYILLALEKQLSGNAFEDGDSYNIEHVLPENPEGAVVGFAGQRVAENVHRLGNLTLMKPSENRALGNLPYEQKRPVYANSGIELTKKIATDNEDWTAQRIASRQNWMAKQAKTIWRISQLS